MGEQKQNQGNSSRQVNQENAMDINLVLTQAQTIFQVVDVGLGTSDRRTQKAVTPIYGSALIEENQFLRLALSSAQNLNANAVKVLGSQKSNVKTKKLKKLTLNKSTKIFKRCPTISQDKHQYPILKSVRSLRHQYNTRGTQPLKERSVKRKNECYKCKCIAKNDLDLIQHNHFVHNDIDKFRCEY